MRNGMRDGREIDHRGYGLVLSVVSLESVSRACENTSAMR